MNVSFIAHSDEALLAAAVILIWHMYNAHVNYDKFPLSPLFITGYLPEEIMKHEYYQEWERMENVVSRNPDLMVDVDEYKQMKKRLIEEQVSTYVSEMKEMDDDQSTEQKYTED